MRYVFGDYTLDTERHELSRVGEGLRLRRKVFQVLAYFLAHHDRVVSKQELLDHVWPEQFLGDAVLNSCLMAVRKVLGDSGRTPRFIRTLYGQGYRFVAAVEVYDHILEGDGLAAAPSPSGHSPVSHLTEGLPSTQALAPSATLPHSPVAMASLTPVGEHKQVTVLCCALAEAATLAVRLGPDAMYLLMHTVLALAHETVQRYAGTITRVSGDGFLALFGAPSAQEDHAQRAVLAALELRQRLRAPDIGRGPPSGVTLAVCMGLHTGPVVVGHLAHHPQRPYTAMGDTIDLATQLQHLAAPDTVLASAATYELVQAEIQGEAGTVYTSDAVPTPVPVYAVRSLTRPRAGVPRRGVRPLSRFVGHELELALLHERLEQVSAGQGQVVGIAGEPGIGKSRLLTEFRQSLDRQPVTYCEGHCLTYGNATPYLPVRDLLRQLCGINDEDAPVARVTKVHQALRDVGIAPEDGGPVLLHLLDMPADMTQQVQLGPAALKARTFALLRHLSLYNSQSLPCVLVVENMHWIDPTSEAWLTSLVEHLAGAAMLLLVTYRPGYRVPWIDKSYVTQVALTPLTPRDSLIVVQSLPQAVQLSADMQQAIIAKAAGNPFFLEELTWAATDCRAQAPGQPIPDTIQAVLATRIDRLPPADKRLLQTAAVIGKDVPLPLLQAITHLSEKALECSLMHLQAAAFFYETRLVPERAYTFKHALTQQVAYQSLLTSTRQGYHQQLAEALAARPEMVETQPELLAQHYTAAGLAAPAVSYWQRAGQRSTARSAYVEAVAHLTRGLAVLQTLPDTPERARRELDMQIMLGQALQVIQGQAAPEVGPVWARARDLCDQVGDTSQILMALGGLEGFYQQRGELRMARELMQQCLARAERQHDAVLLLWAHVHMGVLLYFLGELVSAQAHLEEARALAGSQPERALTFHASQDPMVYCLGYAAWTLWILGYADQSMTCCQAMLTQAQASSHAFSLARALYYAAVLHRRRREGAIAQERAEAALALATAQGFGHYLGMATLMRGGALAVQGQVEAGLAQMHQGLAAIRATGTVIGLSAYLAMLAEAYGESGQAEAGLRLLTEALAHVGHTGERYWEAEVHRLKGELLLQQAVPDAPQAEACFQHALAVARGQQARAWELRAALSLSRLWQQQGKQTAAADLLAPLYGWFTEGFDTPDLQEARALLEALGGSH